MHIEEISPKDANIHFQKLMIFSKSSIRFIAYKLMRKNTLFAIWQRNLSVKKNNKFGMSLLKTLT
jgi:hypothetical protein